MKLRDISTIKLDAAKAAHGGANLSFDEISEIPLATELTKRYLVPLTCTRTGLVVGSIATITVAGHMPLLSQWKDSQAYHPLFSLQPGALLKFSRNSWHRFCALTAEETADEKLVAAQEQLLCICALAMLHNLTEVRQDVTWLPNWQDVVSNWQGLMGLGYWKVFLDSERFRFPNLRISKLNSTVDLRAFIQLCFVRKKEYETTVTANIDDAKKQQAAEAAMSAIYDDLAGKRPRSIRYLWRWFENTMPSKYHKDIKGWMWDIFSATEKDILDFTVAEVDLFETFFLAECEIGSTISHAFLDVLRSKRELLTTHYNTYEIIIPTSIAQGVADGSINTTKEPVPTDFPTRAKYITARAKWKLAQPDFGKRQAEASKQQTLVRIKHSSVPKLVIGAEADVLPEQDDDEDIDDIRAQEREHSVASGFGELE